jgi:hypothetical protein
MPAGEIYVPLSVNFANNAKVRALKRYGKEARPARDLYVQMLLYCKSMRSDGWVPDDEIGVLVYPDPEKTGMRQAGFLAEVGLVDRGVGGYRVTGWLERNSSREDIERKSAAKGRGARHANHRRWHLEADSPDPKCEWCQKSDRTTDRTTDQSSNQTSDQISDSDPIGTAKRSDSKETETETETETESETESIKTLGRQAGRPPEPGSDDDPDWAAFWDAYPRKVAKGQARKAWRTAIRNRKAGPKEIILAAERYRDDRTRTAEFTAHPATWLNGERWADYAAAASQPRRNRGFWED